MAHLLRHPRPRIADVQCSRLQFQPGDRVLVRVFGKLEKAAKKKLSKSIQKWAGCDVEVLIINNLEMELTVDQSH